MNITKKIKIIIPILILAGGLLGFSLNLKAEPQKDKVLIGVLRYILKNWHYEPKEMDDTFSKAVYADFIDEMDPIKRYFTQKDIKEFSQYETLIDDQLKREDLTFYNVVMDRFQLRLAESQNFYKEILKHKFDFDKKEEINVDYKTIEFAKNQNELMEYWRKQMKFNTLNKIQTLLEIEEDKAKEDTKYKKRSFAVLEAEAREKSLESLDNFYKRINELDHTDWFSTFVNSIAEEFDPHTTYFAPKVKELFDINISGKIEGIGARLQQKNDYTKIVELISGGPAWKQGDLEVGDIILKLAQKNEESKDIVGMRLDDAIKLIKGKKGTEVVLTVKKVDNSIQKITIIRDVVELEETFVKSSIAHKDGKKYGVINLPKFYIDFNDTESRDSGSDMEREIENLKKEGIEGLLIDLRNNGGGSLRTAIQIGGLFIDKGPIVQVKYRDNEPAVKDDVDPKIQWDGPLVILVNELSASASEILAAAMQDYKRAVIIGSEQTYGKGTVQNVIPLNKSYNYPEDLGALKLTIQKFYRINGGSTQLEGVRSDIAMPSKYSYVGIGEREQDNPLGWDKIKKANYNSLDYYKNYDAVISNSKMRISQNKEFILINEYAKWLKESQDTNEYSLNLNASNEEQKIREKKSEGFKDVFKHSSKLEFTSPLYELSLIKKDSVLGSKRTAWHENLTKDIYIDESLQVLSELKKNNNSLLAKK
ncbi:carboxy terminal-processing peptidase [Flavicella sediminum]|uniref:carboxy terminal-processing peptidase n=1 Tax=Flavicella sediminum TaxID=2585141 RepID=UPI001123CA36|nr:carboxy terminal-processing peptidase [Flavicella sediminum]